MAIDIPTFRARYPELDSTKISDTTLTMLLDDAKCDFSRSKLSSNAEGTKIYERIVFAIAAHNGQLGIKRAAGDTGGGGAVTSKSVGKVSVSYGRSQSSNINDDFYLQTIYGQEYLQLLNRYCPTMTTIC